MRMPENRTQRAIKHDIRTVCERVRTNFPVRGLGPTQLCCKVAGKFEYKLSVGSLLRLPHLRNSVQLIGIV